MEYFNWILAFHVMSFISWMAALFYLPRLFVYHAEHANKKEFVEVVQIQEYKLYKYIGVPAMWATIISGLAMIYLKYNSFMPTWLIIKLIAASFLIAYHFSLEMHRKRLQTNPHYKKGKFYRIYNEVPTLLMIIIVIMVVVKPF